MANSHKPRKKKLPKGKTLGCNAISPRCLMLFFWLIGFAAVAGVEPAPSVLGQWSFRDEDTAVTAEFTAAGTFQQTTTTKLGRQSYSGRYQTAGSVLQLLPQGASMPLQFKYQFTAPDTMALTDAMGRTVWMRRVQPVQSVVPPKNSLGTDSPRAAVSQSTNVPTVLGTWVADKAANAQKQPILVLERTWEPKEKAFWFLKPKGWIVTGGIFNVNALQMNGPANTIAPKNDLSVKNDEAGTVMFRWAPVWFYADLTFFSTASASFPPGSYYRGMLVKPMPTPKAFLIELLQKTRPSISNLKVIAEDPMREVVEAYVKFNQQLNQGLIQMGKRPNAYDASAILVEYNENGRQFREAIITVIVDTRASTFAWSNERTIMLRAPAAEYQQWKPVLDAIRASDHMNPEWVAAANRNVATRTKMVRETDNYINRVANEIVEHRRKTNAEMRHEQWLFITGQDEYKNPFTGEVERDTSLYEHRWVNNQGDVILTDRNEFDPNQIEEYKTREWKPSPVWDRRTNPEGNP